MPVTAKLSRKFYDTFGDEIANELVEWFNRVDAAYRSEFRDLFEIHFARFDAKLEQRLAEVKTELRGEFQAGFAALRGEMSEGFAALHDTASRTELAQSAAALRSEIGAVRTDFAERLAKTQSSLILWMFGFWAGNVLATAGLVLAAVALFRR